MSRPLRSVPAPALAAGRRRAGGTGLATAAAITAAAALFALAAVPPPASAQPSTAEGIAQYRALLAEGNPAELWEAKGEALWKEKRGPKAASLERCDLGKGPGVVKGVFV